jgi:hypothetical protein
MGERRGVHRVWWGYLRERYHLEDERIIFKWIFKKWDWAMDWIDLVHNRDRWRALVNAVMNLLVP